MKLLFAVAAAIFAAVLAGCGGSDGGSSAPATADPGPIHVHGLGVNPADQALFIASHAGLFRIPEGATEASRVGEDYQDTMGFTVIGPDRFLGSGHPDGRSDLPPFLGLIESQSAGERWEPVSLLGRADFHVLEADGKRIYGFGSDFETRREQFLVSDDGGGKWLERDVPESLLSLAIDPDDPDRVVASGRRSLFASDDGGRTWSPLPGPPGFLSWPEAGSRFLIAQDGEVFASEAAASGWRAVGELEQPPAAFEAESADELFVALHDGSILESSDGGQSWELRSEP